MALKGKRELLEQMESSAMNMQRVRQRKETERALASQQESEPRTPSPIDLTGK